MVTGRAGHTGSAMSLGAPARKESTVWARRFTVMGPGLEWETGYPGHRPVKPVPCSSGRGKELGITAREKKEEIEACDRQTYGLAVLDMDQAAKSALSKGDIEGNAYFHPSRPATRGGN